jgi:hypothetical protein
VEAIVSAFHEVSSKADQAQFHLDFWNEARQYDYLVRVDLLRKDIVKQIEQHEATFAR